MLKIIIIIFYLFEYCTIYGATVKNEKNCTFLLTGDTFKVGDTFVIYKGNNDKKTKAAYVKINKVSKGDAIANIVKGPNSCSNLKGAEAEFYATAKTSKNAKKSKKISLFEGGVLLGTAFTDQNTTENTTKQSISGLGVYLYGDIYPLTDKKTFIKNAFGATIILDYFKASPDPLVTNDNGESVGKQPTNTLNLQFGLLFRVIYGKENFQTEFKTLYQMFKFNTDCTGDNCELSPLNSLTANGLLLGIKEKVFILENIRTDIGFTYGLLYTGQMLNPSTKIGGKINNTSSINVDASVNFILSSFKIWINARYHSIKGKFIDEISETSSDFSSGAMVFGAGAAIIF